MLGQRQQQGMALVITLIMLSVITIVTVAFLAVARRDRASVTNAGNLTDSELMNDGGRYRALGEIAAELMANTNFMGFGLMVSTNMDIDTNTWIMLTNDARAPVFVRTPRGVDFRFYLDLNRNGSFDPTGFMDALGNIVPSTDTNGTWYSGDPQWIAVLENPNLPHTNNNKMIGRYAFIVLPVGSMLDINYIHNQALSANGCQYNRNQGFGTYELNLAAFLADLNTNVWGIDPSGPYQLVFPAPPMSYGFAFQDALELVRYRFKGSNYPPSMSVANIFGPYANKFVNDQIDGLAHDVGRMEDLQMMPWPGGESVQHFFTVHDLLSSSKQGFAGNFATRLRNAGTNNTPYGRNTFYRLLQQIGTDTAPEHDDRINLNYANFGINAKTALPNSPMNFDEWDPTNFFMRVTERMIRREYTNNFLWSAGPGIPVMIRGRFTNQYGQKYYSPRMHQLLKLAANLHDGTKTNGTYPFYPSVFRPQYRMNGGDLFISGYVEETNTAFLGNPWRVLTASATNNIAPDDNVVGVPLIIGARKGYPNFNKFSLQTHAQFVRKLEFRKNTPADRVPSKTNQMFIVGISNILGVQAWNSYTNPFPRGLEMRVGLVMETTVTNDVGLNVRTNFMTNGIYTIQPGAWPGYNYGYGRQSFQVPLFANSVSLSDSVFYMNPTPHFELVGPGNQFETNQVMYTNTWGLMITNRLTFFLIDNGHLVDAVSLSDVNRDFPLSDELNKPVPGTSSREVAEVWSILPAGVGSTINEGVNNQILVSLDKNRSTDTDWRSYSANPISGGDKNKAIDNFRIFMGFPPQTYSSNALTSYMSNSLQAPFVPLRRMLQTTKWEVNDPLVHYTIDDLALVSNPVQTVKAPVNSFTNLDLTSLNAAYKPWGGNPNQDAQTDDTAYDESVKDAGVSSSDGWDFPAQKMPSIGWMGRVHRGTPWQTVYLKSRPADRQNWLLPRGPANHIETHPTNDWWLVDMFTVAQHPNATRGQASVNQKDVATWSAVMAGVEVTTLGEDGAGNVFPVQTNILPAALSPALQKIVDGINRRRTNTIPERQFRKLSDFLSVPELTTASPYLNDISDNCKAQKQFILTDRDYERIPDQIMSLVKLGEQRFVIYAWGQSLKPAPGSISMGTGNIPFGVCTNYQITGEVASRTVVRFEYPQVASSTNGLTEPDYRRPRAVVESYNIMPPE